MIDTSARLLRLLSVLQTRRYWTGPELAERLEVTPRTLRRDVDRLRSLGYAIEGSSGPGGGYQIGQGAAVPPLLLSDDEAVAVAVALRSAADAFTGIGELAMGVLVKLEQLLPARLRRKLGALQAVTVSVASTTPALDPGLLTQIAGACREHELLHFPYSDRSGKYTEREVEPLRLAHTTYRRWYLLAWDRKREDWRTFRVDRIGTGLRSGARFLPRPPPENLEAFLRESVSSAPYPVRARVKLQGSLADLAGRVPPWLGVLEPLDEGHCLLSTGADSAETLIFQVLYTGAEFEVLEPPELTAQLRVAADRIQRALSRGDGGDDAPDGG